MERCRGVIAMKKLIISMFMLAVAYPLYPQRSPIDSLLLNLRKVESKQRRVDILADLAHRYAYTNPQLSFSYADSALSEALALEYLVGQAKALNSQAVRLGVLGRHSDALKKQIEAIRVYDQLGDELWVGKIYSNMGSLYIKMKDYHKALDILNKSISMLEQPHLEIKPSYSYVMLARVYFQLGSRDSSIFYYNKAISQLSEADDQDALAYAKVGLAQNFLCDEPARARMLLLEAIERHEYFQDNNALAKAHLLLGQSYLSASKTDSQALDHFLMSLDYAQKVGSLVEISEAYEALFQWYEMSGKSYEALEAFKLLKQIQDSIAANQLKTELSALEEDFRQYQNAKNQELELVEKENEILTKNFLYSVIGGFVLFMVFLSVAYVQKSRVNAELNSQNVLIAEQKAEVEREKNNALQASHAKAQFLAAMSHEIRTPLNAIVGFSNLLISDDGTNREKDLNNLKYSAENLLSLTNNLLDFSRMDDGEVQLEKIEFSIRNLVDSVFNQFKERANAKGLECVVEYDANIPEAVSGDPTRLGQILSNLVSNAIKFTEYGKVGLSVELLETRASSVSLQFSVKDTGIGISPEKRAIVFEQFNQGEAGMFRRYGGSGLGLAIVKKLTEAMEGEIVLESKVGKGSVFHLKLDLPVSSSRQTLMSK
ncbi:MAG: ATP-binding protein, partial [Bacteroidota bacterium]